MALGNFIMEGSYTKIVSLEYNKPSRFVIIRIETKAQDGTLLFEAPYIFNGNSPCTLVSSVFTTDDEVTSFLNDKLTTTHLVSVPNDSMYQPWIGMVLTFTEGGELSFTPVPYVYDVSTNTYYANQFDGSWKVPAIPACDKYFDEVMSLSAQNKYDDIYNMGYKLLKMRQEFANTIDI